MNEVKVWFDAKTEPPPFDPEQPLELWWPLGGITIGFFDDGLFNYGSFWIPAQVPIGLNFADEGRYYKKLVDPEKWRYPDYTTMLDELKRTLWRYQ